MINRPFNSYDSYQITFFYIIYLILYLIWRAGHECYYVLSPEDIVCSFPWRYSAAVDTSSSPRGEGVKMRGGGGEKKMLIIKSCNMAMLGVKSIVFGVNEMDGGNVDAIRHY